ncbi:MAG: 30S ribosomal protein S5 [Bacteriovoracaceae bacterium]
MTDNTETKEAKPSEKKSPRPKRAPRPAQKKNEVVTDVEERVVAVNRVAKVVKGGRRFSFSALVIVGDKRGRVGFGLGKAKEVPDAIRKASQLATKKMVLIPIEKGTIPHSILGEFDAGKILFHPAAEGTGIKAAGACRTILELAGVKDVLTKSIRGSNPHNVVKATFKALRELRSVEQVAQARGVESKGLRMSRTR